MICTGSDGSEDRVSPREVIVLLGNPAHLPVLCWEPGRDLSHFVEGAWMSLLKTYVQTKTCK